MILPDPEKLWTLTAAELYELAAAGERLRARRVSDLLRANELLAFNTAALVRAGKFPETPEEAFPKRAYDWREAKAEMERIAAELGR
ncbi:MAG: hypothetical protein NC084_13650 [Bacteroides sp.]|nr:hypothetical protein [Eubacterium sp.]MCM1419746.1 hypothetical protein [Roseburia sp.]MCM1463741.1 hypothetical protein [Bacteroides sp.]